jgi:hypothetical protein
MARKNRWQALPRPCTARASNGLSRIRASSFDLQRTKKEEGEKMAEYIEHLERKLREIDELIELQTARLKESDTPDKLSALDELTHLRIRHDDLEKRIDDAKKKGADNWTDLHSSFQEEADGLRETFEKWLTRFD